MNEIKNYKGLRRKPELFGFSPNSFLFFIALLFFSLFIFFLGFKLWTFLVFISINGLNFVVCQLILGNEDLMKKIFDEKFPQEISELTRNRK